MELDLLVGRKRVFEIYSKDPSSRLQQRWRDGRNILWCVIRVQYHISGISVLWELLAPSQLHFKFFVSNKVSWHGIKASTQFLKYWRYGGNGALSGTRY